MDNKSNRKAKWKKILKIIGTLAMFIIVIYFLEWWGAIGLLIFILFFAGFRGWKFRDSFMVGLRGAETSVFGKPLDKQMWGKNEMKNTKVKVTYKGKAIKTVTNKMMAALFFFLWVVFVLIAAYNQ